jgi:cytidylate kinase
MDETTRDPIRIITLSREYGAGGSELGSLLSEQLDWPLLDRDLARRIAERLRCRHEDVEALDEHAPTLIERIAVAFSVVPSDAPILPTLPDLPDPDRLVDAIRQVVLEAARTPPLIVVGRGANCLLQDRRDVLRVRATAPYDARVRRVAARTGAPPERAAADVRHRDADRRHYLQRYFHCAADDPNLYDLQINTATIPLEAAARLVLALVAAAPPATAPPERP